MHLLKFSSISSDNLFNDKISVINELLVKQIRYTYVNFFLQKFTHYVRLNFITNILNDIEKFKVLTFYHKNSASRYLASS